jgi:hypothetical protein
MTPGYEQRSALPFASTSLKLFGIHNVLQKPEVSKADDNKQNQHPKYNKPTNTQNLVRFKCLIVQCRKASYIIHVTLFHRDARREGAFNGRDRVRTLILAS